MHFLREFWKFVQNMCKCVFLRHIFYYFYLQCGNNFLVTKGGQEKKFWDKGRSIKCPAGGGIKTLLFRRGVTVPFPPMPTYNSGELFTTSYFYGAFFLVAEVASTAPPTPFANSGTITIPINGYYYVSAFARCERQACDCTVRASGTRVAAFGMDRVERWENRVNQSGGPIGAYW